MQPVFSGDPKNPNAASKFLRNVLIPGATILLLGYLGFHLIRKYVWKPTAEAISDVGYEFNSENFVIEPGQWKTVPSRVGSLAIKTEDPTQSRYLFGRARWGTNSTAVIPLEQLMATDIDVGTSQGYYEIGMATGKVPKNVRVQVNRR